MMSRCSISKENWRGIEDPMEMTKKELEQTYLRMVADCLEQAERQGADLDVPEGARYIIISDILAKEISERLRNIANGM